MDVQSQALSPQVDDDKCIMHLYLLILRFLAGIFN